MTPRDLESTTSVTLPPPGVDLDLVALLARVGGRVADLVDVVGGESWTSPTPCPDMDVHGVVEHLVAVLEQMTAVAEGERLTGFAERTVRLDEAPVVFRAALDHALAAWSVPGRLDTEYPMPWGPSTGRMLVGFLVVEQAGHGWDLARALGHRLVLAAHDVGAVDRSARAMVTEQLRVPGMFGPEQPAPRNAGALDRLAAFLGRRP